MSTITLHEQIDGLGSRLEQIGSQALALHALATGTLGGHVPSGLPDMLDTIERELMLATHELDLARERTAAEERSLGPAGVRRATA